MKLTAATRRAALSELFKGIQLASKTKPPASASTGATTATSTTATGATSTSSQGKPEKLTGFARFTAPFTSDTDAPPPAVPLTREESNLAGQLNRYLQSELEKNSSTLPVTDHFLDLFTGLNIISNTGPPDKRSSSSSGLLGMTEKQKLAAIANCTDGPQLTHMLDELYYHSRLSRPLASAILKNASFRAADVDHLARLIFGRGNLLGWTVANCYTFKLQIANKYWVLGDRAKAKLQVVDGFEATWVPVLEEGSLPPGVLMGLVKAVLLFERPDLIEAVLAKWAVQDQAQTATPAAVVDRAPVLLLIWIASHKQAAYSLCEQVVETGLALTKDPFYKLVFTCLQNQTALPLSIYKPLTMAASSPSSPTASTDQGSWRAAVVVELAELACTSQSSVVYEHVRSYLEDLMSTTSATSVTGNAVTNSSGSGSGGAGIKGRKVGHAETLSTALALQKLQSFKGGDRVSRSASGAAGASGAVGGSGREMGVDEVKRIVMID